jgi:F0F1-type ATP synthase membrane subunit b/b'
VARAEATQSIEKGSREIQAQAAETVRSLPERAVGLARELAEKVLGRKLAA